MGSWASVHVAVVFCVCWVGFVIIIVSRYSFPRTLFCRFFLLSIFLGYFDMFQFSNSHSHFFHFHNLCVGSCTCTWDGMEIGHRV